MKSLQRKYAIADFVLMGCIYGFLLSGFLWVIGGAMFWFKHGYWGQIFSTCYFMGWSCSPSASGWAGYDQIHDLILLNSSPYGVVAAASFLLYIPTFFIRWHYVKEIRHIRSTQYPQN
jgi:hypothetical protein